MFLQQDSEIEHTVGYFSKKLTSYQKHYSTIEKEAFALILAFQFFEVCVGFYSASCLY